MSGDVGRRSIEPWRSTGGNLDGNLFGPPGERFFDGNRWRNLSGNPGDNLLVSPSPP